MRGKINYDLLAIPKGRCRVLTKREEASVKEAVNRRELKLCHARSGRICEVRVWRQDMKVTVCCSRYATENHHLLGGHGRRNMGESILARNRLDCCKTHHDEMRGVLVLVSCDPKNRAATVVYERKR